MTPSEGDQPNLGGDGACRRSPGEGGRECVSGDVRVCAKAAEAIADVPRATTKPRFRVASLTSPGRGGPDLSLWRSPHSGGLELGEPCRGPPDPSGTPPSSARLQAVLQPVYWVKWPLGLHIVQDKVCDRVVSCAPSPTSTTRGQQRAIPLKNKRETWWLQARPFRIPLTSRPPENFTFTGWFRYLAREIPNRSGNAPRSLFPAHPWSHPRPQGAWGDIGVKALLSTAPGFDRQRTAPAPASQGPGQTCCRLLSSPLPGPSCWQVSSGMSV